MNKWNQLFKELKNFLILWSTQAFSALGSAMTSFALILWSYQQEGSALSTALLSVCSYVPYILMSIFAGALSDKWNKKITMLVCDALAALGTVTTLLLLITDQLEIWHLYGLNALNGLMSTVQQPASEVAVSLLVPQKHYQRTSGLHSLSNSLVSILSPMTATALLTLFGVHTVLVFDLITFVVAFISLAFFIKLPSVPKKTEQNENVLRSAKSGLHFLRDNPGILHLMLFLAAINLVASMYNAALPAMVIPRSSETALGVLNGAHGIVLLLGSIVASLLPKPKSRIRVIFVTLFFSMSIENYFLAFGRSLPWWCFGMLFGWFFVPLMNANLNTVYREQIPIDMQGRVFSARNTFQFFTIPIGYFLGGTLVDQIFEPLMASLAENHILMWLFGEGKGSGAALLFLILAVCGTLLCVIFKQDKHIWALEKKE